MEVNMNRAQRRFLRERMKKRVKRRLDELGWYQSTWLDDDWFARAIGRGAKTRKICSGYCCGTRRKYDGMSLQERRKYRDYKDQLEDL